jgi:hypothetical protein
MGWLMWTWMRPKQTWQQWMSWYFVVLSAYTCCNCQAKYANGSGLEQGLQNKLWIAVTEQNNIVCFKGNDSKPCSIFWITLFCRTKWWIKTSQMEVHCGSNWITSINFQNRALQFHLLLHDWDILIEMETPFSSVTLSFVVPFDDDW